jgi:hypothetical protein
MPKRATKRELPTDGTVLVINDSRDATQDYYLPAERAERLFDMGKLCMVMVYSGKWDYATADGHKVY